MVQFFHSLPLRQPYLPHGSRIKSAALGLPQSITLLFSSLAAFALAACDKKSEPEVKPGSAVVAAPAKPAAFDQTDTALLATLNPAPVGPERPELTDLEREARRVMILYPDKNAQELLNVSEVNPQLVSALKDLAANPQLQAAINKSVDLAAHFKGLAGAPGTYKLNLDVKAYDGPRTQRMLTAVLAGQARPIVQFLAEELGEASFEFSFTEGDKTSNGISLEPNPNPPAAAPADPD